MSYKIAPLTVNPQERSSSIISRVFVSQPSAEDEMLVGRLFILLELDTEKNSDERIADFLISAAYHHYYENEALILRDRLPNLKPDMIFEASIAKINADLDTFLEQEKIKLNPASLNAVIGIVHGNKLLFAQTGLSRALLLYRPKNKKGELLADYSLVDITEKTTDPTQEIVQQNKYFTNVIAGAVPTHGYFFFANESVFEYLTKKQITDIVTTLPPTGAAEQIKNLLENTSAFVPFFGLIIKNTTGEHDAFAAPAASIAVPGSMPTGSGRSSVHQLNLTQEKTEQLLSPSGLINVKKWLNKLSPVSSGLKSYASDTVRKISITKERIKPGQRIVMILRQTIAVIAGTGSVLIGGVKQTTLVITNPEARKQAQEKSKNLIKNTVQSTARLVDRYNHLQPRNKVLVVVVGICILALLGNIAYGGISARRKASAEQIAQASTQFDQKENQLEAALLYNNRDGAKQILDEMSTIVDNLPTRTKDDQARKQEFKNRYEAKLDSIYTIIRLKDDAYVMDLPTEADSLLAESNGLFAASSTSKNTWQIKPEEKTATAIANDSLQNPLIGFSFDDPTQYYIGQSSVTSYKPETGQFNTLSIDGAPTLQAAAVYNNRLYAVADNTIYRFNLDIRNNVFNTKQVWLKDETSFVNPSSMAIDGRIYIIENNSIAKFSGGRRETLTLDPVSPSLEEPKSISLSPDLDFLYILEPKHQRLLVFSKNGRYIAQYTGDGLNNLKSATVDQKNRFVYLLSGQKLFKINATHFGN